jgi:hypothetical protein
LDDTTDSKIKPWIWYEWENLKQNLKIDT